ncbi:MAG TPA: right-handed parallel beta-helix repeat-containing protein, partial [Phycisphaerae bacterium]|nr:right-handed parallel beta-helix repeat-containing protein [Phycisphaerae bacterium]
ASVVDGFTITNAHDLGAIVCLYTSPTIINCVIVGNSASGVFSIWDNPTIANCFIAGNAAGAGGGIHCIHASPTITNCVITGNGALGSIPPEIGGGGIYCSGVGDPIITNCTIANNWSFSDAAGGVFCYECHTGPTLTNCILWGNSDEGPNDESAQIDGCDSEIAVNYCCVQGWTGDLGGVGNIGDDPRFVDADGPDDDSGTLDDDLHFLPCSPCIDAGSNYAVPPGITTDLDGNPRFVDDPYMPDTGSGTPPIVDMGAYEFQADCRGDLNGDRLVDHADLGILLAAWHSTGEGDLDCDGHTGHHDLALLLTHWGEECP